MNSTTDHILSTFDELQEELLLCVFGPIYKQYPHLHTRPGKLNEEEIRRGDSAWLVRLG